MDQSAKAAKAQPCSISQFFQDQSVLITGVTGFLGKALVEKLLRSCPDIKTIYVLVRPKRGVDAKARVDQLLSCPLFQTIKSSSSLLLSKVVAIPGDVTLPELGLSPSDAALLHDHVSIVMHSAATVRFDEPLKQSVKINVEGTKKVLELVKRMKNLKAMVHVSTAYSNCEREEINEMIYPTNAAPNDIIQTLAWMPEDMVDCIKPKLLANKPNTYTYTKHLAERVVQEAMQEDVPVCIVRPSIVAATYEEPIAGWVDNLNGPSGIFVAYGKGILRSLLCYDENKLDVIPLDHVVSLIISAAWYTGTARRNGVEKMGVFNCCSGSENPFYLKEAVPWAFSAYLSAPFSQVIWYPSPYLTPNPRLNSINEFFFHLLPAQLMDLKARISGEKPLMMFFYHKVKAGVMALRFFCTHEWKFSTENTKTLYTLLGPEDQRKFRFNIRDVDWKVYIENYVLGLRRFAMKEDDSSIPDAKKNLKRLYVLHCGVQAMLCLLAFIVIGLLLHSVTTRVFSTY